MRNAHVPWDGEASHPSQRAAESSIGGGTPRGGPSRRFRLKASPPSCGRVMNPNRVRGILRRWPFKRGQSELKKLLSFFFPQEIGSTNIVLGARIT